MESRLLHILIQKYKDTSEVRGLGARQTRVRLQSWTNIISSAGCELMSSKGLKSDDRDIFVNHLAWGTVRIPRDIALKILVLGGLP
jgi:hypothetical protein